jgi:GNAT superfamily N-acetyltransferase
MPPFRVGLQMISIQPFESRHLRDLYAISLATGHQGGDAAHLYEDPDLMGHIYAAPYAVLDPSRVLVAVDDLGIAGYALGAIDTAAWEERLDGEWWPPLRNRIPDPGKDPKPNWSANQRRQFMIHHPTRVPSAVCGPYPAHLHMNLLRRAQGSGLGLRLLDAWMALAEPFRPVGIHVGVNRQNEKALRFWARAGFRELDLPDLEPDRTAWMGRNLSAV